MRMSTVTRRVPSLLVVALLLLTVSVSAMEVWLSGPSYMWSQSASAALNAVTQDFQAALGSGTTVTSVTAQEAPMSPAIGAVVVLTPDGGVSDDQALATLRAATLTNVNNIAAAVSATVHVLAVLPAAATQVGTAAEETALSGASFFWKTALEELAGKEAGLVLPLEVDAQASVNPAEDTYLVHILTPTIAANVNASAMFVDYEWWRIDASGTASAAELTTKLNAAPLTSFNTYMNSLVASGAPLYDYRSLLPADVHFTRALYEDPNGGDVSTVLPVLSNTTTSVLMYFSGDKSGWDMSSPTLSAAIASDASTALERGGFVNTAAVESMTYVTPSKNTLGGLVVTATVTQGAQGTNVDPWDDSSVASVLLTGTYNATVAQYTGADTAALSGVSLDKKYGFKCTAGCVGMIVMSAVVVFLMLVAALVIGIILCCCFDYDKNAESRARDEDCGDFKAPRIDQYAAGSAAHADPYHRENPLNVEM